MYWRVHCTYLLCLCFVLFFSFLFFSMQYLWYGYELCMLNIEINLCFIFCSVMFCSVLFTFQFIQLCQCNIDLDWLFCFSNLNTLQYTLITTLYFYIQMFNDFEMLVLLSVQSLRSKWWQLFSNVNIQTNNTTVNEFTSTCFAVLWDYLNLIVKTEILFFFCNWGNIP